jgi:hypothetical protein
MASPNACGGVVLLLSALVQAGAGWSEASIRRAIENTARVTANATGDAVDHWALGRGLLDVEAAHEWLLAHASYAQRDARFEARCTTPGCATAAGTKARGLTLPRTRTRTRTPNPNPNPSPNPHQGARRVPARAAAHERRFCRRRRQRHPQAARGRTLTLTLTPTLTLPSP